MSPNKTAFRSPAARLLVGLSLAFVPVGASGAQAPAGEAGKPYSGMPSLAPIGMRPDRYLPLPDAVASPPIDPAKGYRLQKLGRDLYMVTDNAYQSMFLVHESGVLVVDAPPAYSARLRAAIAEVTDRPVTHVVYSHAHADHIGGVTDLGGKPVLVAQEETARILSRARDPKRPVPTVTFKDGYTLAVGSRKLELSYKGVAHQPGNIFIYAPEQQVLMAVDLVFPGWMPWRRFALAQDVAGYFEQVAAIGKVPFKSFVGGHVSRVGTHEDVRLQLEFMNDLKAAAGAALRKTAPGEELAAEDRSNPWAIFDNYIDRVAAACVAALAPKWQTRLAAFDVYIWDQCYAMEQSLRID
jgi:glyoxylase-like metal-dependent hydrolase (beta-lactamase superfamily II)